MKKVLVWCRQHEELYHFELCNDRRFLEITANGALNVFDGHLISLDRKKYIREKAHTLKTMLQSRGGNMDVFLFCFYVRISYYTQPL